MEKQNEVTLLYFYFLVIININFVLHIQIHT